MKKQFLRVKQIADQTFLRAEKTDVLTEDLVTAEKRIDVIRVSCQTTQKKISSCNIDFGSETSSDKRLRKIPQISLGTSMLENSSSFSKCSVLGETLRECSTVQTKLGNELLEYQNEVERTVLKPISVVLDNDVHNINKLRKQLGKLVLDMDSARTRFQTAERHSMQGSSNASFNVMGKIDSLKDELEDASQRVEQCRDTLATEMFSLISKEPHLAQLLVHFHRLQAEYHRNALAALEDSLPLLEQQILDFPLKPVYGCSLEEHLRVTSREIALVIETCVSFLLEYGILEEGLLRIAGSTSKVKKLKSAFDAGVEMDMTEFIRDPHAVSGALKSYLRELPEPLITFSLYEEWIAAAKIQDFDAKLQAVWQVLHKLPDANFKNLRFVIKFLSRLHENVDVNKMSSQNIAIVMAPNLIWSLSEDASRMNMSIASLHTSIVDTLISYADWFFPEPDVLPSPRVPDMNESVKASDIMNESVGSDIEINGNNSQSQTSTKDASPRVQPRNVKKPAAPPPPAQRSVANCDKNMNDGVIPTGQLVDFSMGDAPRPIVEESVPPPLSAKENCSSTHLSRRKSNENFNNELLGGSKSDKPSVHLSRRKSNENFNEISGALKSERPSTCNENFEELSGTGKSGKLSMPLRKSNENFNNELLGISKGDKTSTSNENFEDLSGVSKSAKLSMQPSLRKSNENLDKLSGAAKGDKPAIPDKPCYSSCSLDRRGHLRQPCPIERPTVPPPERPDKPPPKFCSTEDLPELQRSRSSSKVNRFDFLVSQVSERPPERPPRSTLDQERTSSSSGNFPEGGPSHKASESEKAKPPPRPQPPLPAKPRFNMANENTNL